MTNGCSVTKEFHRLLKTVGRMSDGQAQVTDWDDEDVTKFTVIITPNGGPYLGGTFEFKVELGGAFPEYPPQVMRCETQIYHPNIDPTDECGDTNICLNVLSDEWMESFGIDDVIQGFLFLFHEPNIEDPLSPYFDSQMGVEEFHENVLLSLKGECVEGVDYPVNFRDDTASAKTETVVTQAADVAQGVADCAARDKTSTDVQGDAEGVSAVTKETATDSLDTKTEKAEKPVTPQPQSESFNFAIKSKDINTQVLNSKENLPDVICMASSEVSESEIISPDCPYDLTTKTFKSVSFNSFDAVLPEMNLVFTLMNCVTKSVVMKT